MGAESVGNAVGGVFGGIGSAGADAGNAVADSLNGTENGTAVLVAEKAVLADEVAYAVMLSSSQKKAADWWESKSGEERKSLEKKYEKTTPSQIARQIRDMRHFEVIGQLEKKTASKAQQWNSKHPGMSEVNPLKDLADYSAPETL